MNFVIGIAGGSGSGKSTIAQAIQAAVAPQHTTILKHDNYYRDMLDLPESKRAEQNFDHPNALESSLLAEQLKQLKNNLPIEEPIYDFVHHCRTQTTTHIDPSPVIIVEGILTLAAKELLPYFDLKLFIDTDPDIRFIRRLTRDIEERGRTLDMVVHQYQCTVRPMHLEFVEPSKRIADVIIPENGENLAALDLVIAKVKSIVGQ